MEKSTTKKRVKVLFRNLILITGTSLTLFFFSCRDKKIYLYDGTWTSIWIENAVFKVLAEKGYGYEVIQSRHTEQVLKLDLANGNIDIAIEMWQQNNFDWYIELINNQQIYNLGSILPSGKQFWIIPKPLAEQYNIKSVYDMKEHWELFTTTSSPSRGVFYNCTSDWDCSLMNTLKMKIYGLDKYYKIITPGSEAVLQNALESNLKNKKPVFGYYWSPTYISEKYEWYILKEPKYDPDLWIELFHAMRDPSYQIPERACAYPDTPIDKIIHKNLLKKAPDLVKVLEKIKVDYSDILLATEYLRQDPGLTAEDIAIFYLENSNNKWKDWVNDRAEEKIAEFLNEKKKK